MIPEMSFQSVTLDRHFVFMTNVVQRTDTGIAYMCSAVWALAASCLVLYRIRAVPWVRFRWNVSSGPCCMQIVLKVDPSI